MGSPIDEARAAGYGEDEIQAFLAPKIQAAQDAGYSPDEIAKHLGIKPVDNVGANARLAERVHAEVTAAKDGGMAKHALRQMGQTVKDTATVYAPVEAALNLATGLALGFPTYLGTGLATVIGRAAGLTDADPKDVATKYANVVTYNPQSDAGARMATTLNYPLQKLTEWAEAGGKAVADKTGSPTAAAITEATLQVLPQALLGSFGRRMSGKTVTNSDVYTAAKDIAPEAPHPVVNELAGKVQKAYEKSGVDPEALKAEAIKDPTVLQDLASDNRDVPVALEMKTADTKTISEGGGEPPKPPAPETPPEPPTPGTPEAAQAAVLDRVSVGEVHRPKRTLAELYTSVVDDLYPIAEIEKKLANGGTLDTAESAYKLARLSRGSAGKAAQFLDHGTFDFKSYENTGPSLKAILEPHKNDLDGFRAYAVARRAVELDKRGIETGVPLEEAKQVAGDAKYAKAFEEVQAYQNSLVKYLRDAGVISEKNYATMLEANKDYVPFQRLFEGASSTAVGNGLRARNPIKAIKGSERVIIDPLESIIKNTYLYTALAERNAVGAAFGKAALADPALAESLGVTKVKTSMKPIEVSEAEVKKFMVENGIEGDAAAFDIFRPNALRPGPDQIRYFEDGKPVTLKVPDAVAEAFNATDRQTASALVKILSIPARTLRAGSVLSPDFMLRNVARDQITAYAFSKNGYIPVWDMASGFMSITKQDAAFQNWLKSGGANSTLVSMDREYLQKHLVELDKNTGLMSRAWNVVSQPLDVLRIVSELGENATRVGEFKRAMTRGPESKAQMQDAAFQSREVTLDFARIGAQTRALNQIAAFMNAGVQGLDRTARAFKDAPMATTAKLTAAITLPSMLLWAMNKDDPRYAEIPAWQKDMFWIAMTDDHIYRIPKPFEVGVMFGSVPERMLEAFYADNPDGFRHFSDTLKQAFGVNAMPTGAVPVLEQLTNHSFFTGNPLIPGRLEKILPEYQYQEYTSELTKSIGQLVGAFPGLHDKSVASPVVIDNYIRGWTGSIGVYVRDALDAGLRKAGVLPDPPQPVSTLADIPVIKAFVVRYPSATAQSIQDFYETYGKLKKEYDTIQHLVEEGDVKAAQKEAGLDPNAFAQMDGISESLSEINKSIRLINKNPDVSPVEQRQLIDSMYGQMIELSRAGNEVLRDVAKSLRVPIEKNATQ